MQLAIKVFNIHSEESTKSGFDILNAADKVFKETTNNINAKIDDLLKLINKVSE